ncbi:galactokinase [Deinococcus maricopensis]|uniref:Galactokinase n=1 Tax=Deinococcus maricopensis (strain DSM 21211 / LMG 22137 / NRRL B-23946 / LB-34) TaxID=709986 RepID=E8U7J1_DEIML|nr:galactokinase [Deinococcus maricopensis]ADV67030.1 galactokinase [Deinococcus maricopensis DSM 21211]
MKTFDEVFGRAPDVTASAPGRVNLLGEHTDYQGGFVLPTAIPQDTTVHMGRNGTAEHRVYAADLERHARFPVGANAEPHFAQYVAGALALAGVQEGVDVHVTSTVPMGAGLSSSAALEVSTLRAARELFALDLDDVRVAQIAQRAEIEFAGVNCGIMDQMASSLADARRMLRLDTRTLERETLPLPGGAQVLVIDSGVPRSLAESGYNTRRAEVEEASRLLGVHELRDVTDVQVVETLPEPLNRRARHVVTENARVLAAVNADAAAFGQLMNASHASLRDDYEVSHPKVDELVELLQTHADVFGARMTGAGFGGALVALVREGAAEAVAADVLAQYDGPGRRVVP